MEKAILLLFISFILGWIMVLIVKSFKSPDEGKIQVIMRFNKLYSVIMSVEGMRVNDPHKSSFVNKYSKWEIIPREKSYIPSLAERLNLYLFLWPIFKTYKYPFSYTKVKKKGTLDSEDTIVWSDENGTDIVVQRSGTSNFMYYQAEYPTITSGLYTRENAKVTLFTNNTFKIVNPEKALFKINNYLGMCMKTVGGALKGVTGELTLQELNQIRSETEDEPGDKNRSSADFTRAMKWINRCNTKIDDGIVDLWGVELTKSVYNTFSPGDDQAEELLDSFLRPGIEENLGKAAIVKAEKEGVVIETLANAKAKAYATEQEPIVKWRKKYLVDTGLAKVDSKGNITDLVPDANVRVGAEAMKEWSKLKGTLVVGGEDIMKMFSIPTTQNKEQAKGGATL